MLIAAIRQVEWGTELVKGTYLWPTSPKPGPDDRENEDNPWATGP